MSDAQDLHRQIVIPVRAGVGADVNVAVERLRMAVSKTRYRSGVVFIAGAPATTASDAIAAIRTRLPEGGHACTVFAPPELRHREGERDDSALAKYLLETLPAKMGRESFALDIVLQRDWPELSLACGLVVAMREEVRLIDPATGTARRPVLSRGLVQRLGLRTHPTGAPIRRQLIGSSALMVSLVQQLEQLAPHSFPVLLEGETGVGKELCARLLHEASPRAGRFIAVNGALLDPARAEDELCGHVKGAFTGADSDRMGRIREADKGTFFLDELLALPTLIQPMLLRTFNHAMEGDLEVTPLGQDKSERVDVRLVTAVQPLEDVALSPVRDDLLFRVEGYRVVIPPLRDRGDDVLEIAEAALEHLHSRHAYGPSSIDAQAGALLRRYSWPGNVRQLHMVLRRAWVSNRDARSLTGSHLAPHIPAERVSARPGSLRAEVRNLVNRRIEEARALRSGSANDVARSLGFDKGQAMERYQKKCEHDAADVRRRRGAP